MNLNDDTKQFIANGIALKFGEMATRLVKQHKFYSPEYGSHEIDAYSEWESEDNQAADDDIDHALNEYYAAVESGRGVDEAKTNATAALDRYQSHLTGESRNKAGNQPRYDDPEQVNDIVNAIGQAIQDPEGGRVSVDEAKKSSVTASDKRQAAAEEAKKKEQDEQWANRPYAEDWRVEEAAARIEAEKKGIVDEDYEREMGQEGGGEGGEEKPKPGGLEESQMDYIRKEYQAGRMSDEEEKEAMAPFIEKYGTEVNEGILDRETERLDTEEVNNPASGRCPDGSRKDPKTGQCKPHQARQTMNNNVKMYIANGIAMRFGQVAANFVKTMKFQGDDIYPVSDFEPDHKVNSGAQQRALNHVLGASIDSPDNGDDFVQAMGEMGFLFEPGTDASTIGTTDEETGDFVPYFTPEQAALANEKMDTAKAEIEGGGYSFEETIEVAEDFHKTEIRGSHPGAPTEAGGAGAEAGGEGAEGGDTGVEGGDPVQEAYAGFPTDAEIAEAKDALKNAKTDGERNAAQEKLDALDAQSEQAFVDYNQAKWDKAHGKEGEEGGKKSDRCETGTHKDPKTGQCKPI